MTLTSLVHEKGDLALKDEAFHVGGYSAMFTFYHVTLELLNVKLFGIQISFGFVHRRAQDHKFLCLGQYKLILDVDYEMLFEPKSL